MFTENMGLKVISFGLALLLEVYFYSPDNSVITTFTAAVDLVGLPASTLVIEPADAAKGLSVQVQVRGPKPLIDQVRSVQQRFRVSPPLGAGNSFMLEFRPGALSLPAGVEVLNIDPSRIDVRLEREAKKELLVIPDKVGTPPEGYQIDQVEIFPDTVVVRGPKSRVETLKAIETLPIDVSSVTGRIRREVSLKDPGSMISPSVTMVAVDIKASEVPQQKTLSVVPIKVLAPPGFAASVQPTKATVTLGGPPSLLNGITVDTLTLNADGRDLGTGRHAVPLTSELPEGVQIIKTNPAKVAVILSSAAAEQ